MSCFYITFDTPELIEQALDVIKHHRLGRPGDGIITLMSRRKKKYEVFKIIIAVDIETCKPVGCLALDLKCAIQGWSTFRDDPEIPNEFFRVNVWVKPAYRRRGIGKRLLEKSCVQSQRGVECYDTGPASRRLYSVLKDARVA